MTESGKSADSYYAAVQKLPDAFLRDTFTDNGLTEDEVGVIQANAIETRNNDLLGQNSGSVDSRIAIESAQANRRRGERTDKATKARNDDSTLMAILGDIAQMESRLAAQYGENFAGNLFSDLHGSGLIEDDE